MHQRVCSPARLDITHNRARYAWRSGRSAFVLGNLTDIRAGGDIAEGGWGGRLKRQVRTHQWEWALQDRMLEDVR